MKFHRFGTILPFFGPKNGPSKELDTQLLFGNKQYLNDVKKHI